VRVLRGKLLTQRRDADPADDLPGVVVDGGADADDARLVLLVVDRVPLPAHLGQISQQRRLGRTRVGRAPGQPEPPAERLDLLVGLRGQHRFADRGGVQPDTQPDP